MTSSTPPKLLIRADASPELGAGHVLRCLALAQGHRQRGGEVLLRTCLEPSSPLAQRYLACGCEVETVQEPLGSEADCQATLQCLQQLEGRHVVVDGYHFGHGFQTGLCGEHRVLWIDDQAHAAPYHATWILNQNLHAQPEHYAPRQDTCSLLLGPRYALLRQEFSSWQGNHPRTTPAKGHRVLVTLGGGDADFATGKVMEALLQLRAEGKPFQVRVVLGGLSPHRERLRQMVVQDPETFEVLFDVDDMAPLMAWADLAVTAAGSTSWELACLGLPALVGVLAENQVPIAEQVELHGTAKNLGWYRDLSVDRIADAVADMLGDASLRASASSAGRRLVDGQGVQRVLDELFGPADHPHDAATHRPETA